MAIRKYYGERLLPREIIATSQLEKNRVVKITADVPAYPTYGEKALGFTRVRGDENNYEVSVMPFDYTDTTFFLRLAGTVVANAALFATGAVGAVKGAGNAAADQVVSVIASRNLSLDASPALGDAYIVPSGATQIATWNASGDITGAVLGDIVYYDGANWVAIDGTTVATTAGNCTPTAGDVYYVTDEGKYVIWSGSAWVDAHILCYAGDAGVATEEIACYINEVQGKVSTPAAITLVALAQVTAADDATTVAYLNDSIAEGDLAFVTSAEDTTTGLADLHAVVTSKTVTLTFTDPGATGATFNILVVRNNA